MTHIYTLRFKSGDVFRFTNPGDEFTVELDDIPVVGCHRDASDRYQLGVYPNAENFQPVLAIDPPVGKDPKDMSFEELLAAASLGSPESWAVVQSTPPDLKKSFEEAFQRRRDQLVKAAMGDDYGPMERQAEEEPTDEDLESMKKYAPFTDKEVDQLQSFQDYGNFHPFTCGNGHPRQVNLTPDNEGWVCPVDNCDYEQAWAWIAMFDPKNLLGSYGHPNRHGCSCKVEDTGSGWRIVEADPMCRQHPQLVEVLEEFPIPDEDVEAAAKLMNEKLPQPDIEVMARKFEPKDLIDCRCALEVFDGYYKIVELSKNCPHHGTPDITREQLDEAIISPVYRTQTGKLLTDADVQQLSDEADQGNSESVAETLAAANEDDCDGGVDEDMTPEAFDEAMAKGTPVEIDVQLDRKEETFDEANPSQQ